MTQPYMRGGPDITAPGAPLGLAQSEPWFFLARCLRPMTAVNGTVYFNVGGRDYGWPVVPGVVLVNFWIPVA